MAIPTHVDVAIIGAGPVGLTTACLLRKAGLSALVFEASQHAAVESRAIIIHSRTLERVEALGVREEILRLGRVVTDVAWWNGGTVLGGFDFSRLKAKFPCIVMLPQAVTERVLCERLGGFGGKVMRGLRFTGCRQDEDGVVVKLERCPGREKVVVTAKYLVAADGLNSAVRRSLNMPFEGAEHLKSFITADCRLEALGLLKPGSMNVFLNPEGIVIFVPQPSDLWRIFMLVDKAHAPKLEDTTVETYQKLVDARLGEHMGVKLQKLTWKGRFQTQSRLVQRYRCGRVFLAGDAAHVHSPVGGQGMNVGIQDGVRLGELLCEALLSTTEEGTREEILRKYEVERRPVARGVIRMTDWMLFAVTLSNPIACVIRDFLVWVVLSLPFIRMRIIRRLAGFSGGR